MDRPPARAAVQFARNICSPASIYSKQEAEQALRNWKDAVFAAVYNTGADRSCRRSTTPNRSP